MAPSFNIWSPNKVLLPRSLADVRLQVNEGWWSDIQLEIDDSEIRLCAAGATLSLALALPYCMAFRDIACW